MRIFSIYRSISGELGLFQQGSSTMFVRLAGCNLRCSWCDTERSWVSHPEQEQTIESIVAEIERVRGSVRQVLITGGEPLLQIGRLERLCGELSQRGMILQIETNGSILPTSGLLSYVSYWVVDYKFGGSGEQSKMRPVSDYLGFGPKVCFKFPCANMEDFSEAVRIGEELVLLFVSKGIICSPMREGFILFSPVSPLKPNALLAAMDKAGRSHAWIQRAALNTQLHKIIQLVED